MTSALIKQGLAAEKDALFPCARTVSRSDCESASKRDGPPPSARPFSVSNKDWLPVAGVACFVAPNSVLEVATKTCIRRPRSIQIRSNPASFVPVESDAISCNLRMSSRNAVRFGQRLAWRCLKNCQFEKIGEREDAAGMAVGKAKVQAIVPHRRCLFDRDTLSGGAECAVDPRPAAAGATALHTQLIGSEIHSPPVG